MKVWHNSGGENNFYYGPPTAQSKVLDVGVYDFCWDDHKKCFYLAFLQPEFQFNMTKLYNFDEGFVNHVCKTYENTNGNMGVLLAGIKGCGKTVSAKQICRKLKLPVVLIPRGDWNGMNGFFSEIKQDLILFIDEFEKTFETTSKQERLLSMMDGAYSDKQRRLFLLTSNTIDISQNLLQRPGRVRYIKKYTQLQLSVIEEVVDDRLKFPEFKSSLMQFFSGLSLLTIDVVSTIIDEVNIHKQGPEVFGSFFNVVPGCSTLFCYKIDPNDSERTKLDNFGSLNDPSKLMVGDYIGGNVKAFINDKISNTRFTVQHERTREIFDIEFVSKSFKNNAFKKRSKCFEGGGRAGEKDFPGGACETWDPGWEDIEENMY